MASGCSGPSSDIAPIGSPILVALQLMKKVVLFRPLAERLAQSRRPLLRCLAAAARQYHEPLLEVARNN